MATVAAPIDATSTAAWKALEAHQEKLEAEGIDLKAWFAADADRVNKLSFDAGDLHFDLSKKTTEGDSSEYYTVQEAMKKYSLTRDSVYGILQFHEIKREKKGRFVRFLKVEFDHIMGAR